VLYESVQESAKPSEVDDEEIKTDSDTNPKFTGNFCPRNPGDKPFPTTNALAPPPT